MGLGLEINLKKILFVLGVCLLSIAAISHQYPLTGESTVGITFAVVLILIGASVRVLSKQEIEELAREYEDQ
jgi:uncharacterized membrane protein